MQGVRNLTFTEGEVILFEGEEGDCMYEILSGQAAVVSGYGTDHEVTIVTLVEGQTIGEMALLDKAPRSTSVISKDNHTVLREIKVDEVEGLLRTNPFFAEHMMSILSERLRNISNARVQVLATIQEVEDAQKLGIARSDGLIARTRHYIRQAGKKSIYNADSLEHIWGSKNRRQGRDACIRGRSHCDRNHPVFREGEKGDCMYYVYEGEVGIYDKFGTLRQRKLATLQPGDYFGEMGMIEHMARSATAIAENDETYVEQIFEEDVPVLVEKTPEVIADILAYLSRRIRQVTSDYYDACVKLSEMA